MASSREYLNFIMEQLPQNGQVSFRPMMGEYIIYYRGRVVGGIYDDRFLVKITDSAAALMPEAAAEIPYAGAREMLLVDSVDDRAFLGKLLEAVYCELPAPVKRNPKSDKSG